MGEVQEAILEADRLCLKFGAVHALREVSIRVNAGEIHAVIGPNGAGKSSLLNCLSGFYQPFTGSVRFLGQDISGLPPHRRAAIGIGRTFQGIQTYPSMTARENILSGFHTAMKGGVFSALFRPPHAVRQEEAFAPLYMRSRQKIRTATEVSGG